VQHQEGNNIWKQIDKTNIKKMQDFNQLYSERENTKSLIKYLTEKLKSASEPKVREEIAIQKIEVVNKMSELEKIITEAGLPLFETSTAQTYFNVSQEINALETADDLFDWVLYNSQSHSKNQIRKLRTKANGVQITKSKVTGKWLGQSLSEFGFYPGEFSLGVIQLENKLFGCGALLGSIYDKVCVRGLADEDEIRIEVYGENVPEITFFHGSINPDETVTKIFGNYFIANGYDRGKITSNIEKEFIQVSDKSQILVLLANFRDIISNGELDEVRNYLEANKNLLEEPYQNEIILFMKKINDLNRIKRLQTSSFSEIQIEETKITVGVLGLIKEIERSLNT